MGYLLKDRVAEVADFVEALERVAAGGTVIDPDVASRLVGRARTGDGVSQLTDREREVLSLMAQGRSNRANAGGLFVTERTVEAHVRSIFLRLGIPEDSADHRSVLAVVTYLRAGISGTGGWQGGGESA